LGERADDAELLVLVRRVLDASAVFSTERVTFS